METLTQIQQADVDRRQQALKFQGLTNRKLKYEQAIEILTPQVKAVTDHVSVIEKIDALVAQLPSDIPGKGGFLFRHLLTEQVAFAQTERKRRLAELSAKLKTCRDELAKVTEDLKTFE